MMRDDVAALAWYASFVEAADPILAEYGYENEDRRVEGGWAHWRRLERRWWRRRPVEHPLAIRSAVVGEESWADIQGKMPAELRARLEALGALPERDPRGIDPRDLGWG